MDSSTHDNGSCVEMHFFLVSCGTFFMMLILIGKIKYQVMSQGYDAEGVSIVYYIFALLRGGLHVAVMVLIGAGWLFIKASLSAWEKRIVIFVVATHLCRLIAKVIQEESVYGSQTWKDAQMFILFDFVGLLLILLPVVRTQNHLEQSTEIPGKGTLPFCFNCSLTS